MQYILQNDVSGQNVCKKHLGIFKTSSILFSKIKCVYYKIDILVDILYSYMNNDLCLYVKIISMLKFLIL